MYGRYLVVGPQLWESTNEDGVLVRDGKDTLLGLGIENGKLVITAQIRGRDGRIGMEIDRNRWDSKSFEGWEVNVTKDKTIFEVRDPFGDVLLQVVAFDDVIAIEAIFYTGRGLAFGLGSVTDEFGRTGSAFGKWRLDMPEPLMAIDPICKYPASINRGDCPGFQDIVAKVTAAKRNPLIAVLSEGIDLGTAKLNESVAVDADTMVAVIEMSVDWDLPSRQPVFSAISLRADDERVIEGLCRIRTTTEGWSNKQRLSCIEYLTMQPLRSVVALKNVSKHDAFDVWVCLYDSRVGGFFRAPYGFPFVPVDGGQPLFGLVDGPVEDWNAITTFYQERNPDVVFPSEVEPTGKTSRLLIVFHDINGAPYLEYYDVDWIEDRPLIIQPPRVSPLLRDSAR